MTRRPLHPGRVLHRVGNTQDGTVKALLAFGVDGIGRGACFGRIEIDDGCELTVLRLDTGDCHLGDVACPDFTRTHRVGNGGGTLIQQLRSYSFPPERFGWHVTVESYVIGE